MDDTKTTEAGRGGESPAQAPGRRVAAWRGEVPWGPQPWPTSDAHRQASLGHPHPGSPFCTQSCGEGVECFLLGTLDTERQREAGDPWAEVPRASLKRRTKRWLFPPPRLSEWSRVLTHSQDSQTGL